MRPVLPPLLALCLALPIHAEEQPADAAPASTDAAESAAPTPPARAPLEERNQDSAAALQRQLPKDEQQLLSAGDEQFLTLWKPANAAEAKGLVILLPGSDESADWPQAIQPLRLKLPDVGWSSLSLSLPDSQAAPLPPALLPRPAEPAKVDAAPAKDDAPAPAEAAASTPPAEPPTAASTPPLDPAKRIFARIQAGIAFAEQQDAKNLVLLGHGEGAYWAALYLKENKPGQIRQLVTVAAQLPAGQTPPLEELIPGLKLATGDFFYQDLPAERGNALRRKQASKRLGHDSYSQIALQTLPGDSQAEQEQLFRRVRGWLDKQ